MPVESASHSAPNGCFTHCKDDNFWRTIKAAGAEQARVGYADHALRLEAAQSRNLDSLSAAHVCFALKTLNIFTSCGERHSIDGMLRHGRILHAYRKVLKRWLSMLVADGLIVYDGESFANIRPLPTEAMYIALSEQNKLSSFYGENLPALLTGKKHPLEFLIPEGSSDSIEKTYIEKPIFRFCNGVVSRLIGSLIQSVKPDCPIRVLEIGGGTGGTTASVLPLLPESRSTFVFTDISKYFLDLGKRKFRAYPFVKYQKLNIEISPREQGYNPGSFDLVLAAHVLHATRKISDTVRHVRELLQPGGILLLLEETRFRREFNFNMGFLPGFDRFDDYELRPEHPLLSTAQWHALLKEGFDGFSSFAEPGSPPDIMGVDVLLSRAL